jgi:hypothetical protein
MYLGLPIDLFASGIRTGIIHAFLLFTFVLPAQHIESESEFLAANPEVPGSIPDATRFSE